MHDDEGQGRRSHPLPRPQHSGDPTPVVGSGGKQQDGGPKKRSKTRSKKPTQRGPRKGKGLRPHRDGDTTPPVSQPKTQSGTKTK